MLIFVVVVISVFRLQWRMHRQERKKTDCLDKLVLLLLKKISVLQFLNTSTIILEDGPILMFVIVQVSSLSSRNTSSEKYNLVKRCKCTYSLYIIVAIYYIES